MIQEPGNIKSFTDLHAWQHAHKLVIAIYKITDSFPDREIYSLTNQVRRAVVSVSSNIAEGFGRHTYKEKTHFYYQAQGSLIEVKNHLHIAKDVNYIDSQQFDDLYEKASVAHQILQGLIKKSKTYIKKS